MGNELNKKINTHTCKRINGIAASHHALVSKHLSYRSIDIIASSTLLLSTLVILSYPTPQLHVLLCLEWYSWLFTSSFLINLSHNITIWLLFYLCVSFLIFHHYSHFVYGMYCDILIFTCLHTFQDIFFSLDVILIMFTYYYIPWFSPSNAFLHDIIFKTSLSCTVIQVVLVLCYLIFSEIYFMIYYL